MDHTHSQLPLGGFYAAYNDLLQATKDNPAINDKVKALTHHIPERAPCDRIRTVVDNSDSMDSSVFDYTPDKNSLLLNLMRQAESLQAINLGQVLASASASQSQTLTQGRYDAVQPQQAVSGSTPSPITINAGANQRLSSNTSDPCWR